MATSPRIALVTYAPDPEVQPDDLPLADALRRRGAIATAHVWDDPSVDWTEFDALVIRSTWDYFLKPDRFREWLDTREAEGTQVLNPIPAVRWNMDKRYLRDLAQRGIATVPTHWVEPGERAELAVILRDREWDEAVVKPAVSAAAHETWRTRRALASSDDARLHTLGAKGALLVQPFLPEIERDGEWSLLFFAGRYSHSARKRPRAGDFRVQSQHGGAYSAEPAPTIAVDAAQRVIAVALRLLRLAPAALPYARVDGCIVDGAFLLMELEIIEPSLYFGQSPAAAERCAEALLAARSIEVSGPKQQGHARRVQQTGSGA